MSPNFRDRYLNVNKLLTFKPTSKVFQDYTRIERLFSQHCKSGITPEAAQIFFQLSILKQRLHFYYFKTVSHTCLITLDKHLSAEHTGWKRFQLPTTHGSHTGDCFVKDKSKHKMPPFTGIICKSMSTKHQKPSVHVVLLQCIPQKKVHNTNSVWFFCIRPEELWFYLNTSFTPK